MAKGGYQIIDLKNKLIDDTTGVVFKGLYDKIEGCTKAILLERINIDLGSSNTLEIPAAFVVFTEVSDTFVGILKTSIDTTNRTVDVIQIVVDDDDKVIITSGSLDVPEPEEEVVSEG